MLSRELEGRNSELRDPPDVDTASYPRRRVFVFIVISAILAFSFFFRHVAGYIVTKGAYNPLTYNPVYVRVIPPPQYDFKPDDAVWDETRAYARHTQGMLRGELSGPTFPSYAPYVEGALPHGRDFFRDGLGQLVLSWIARLPGSSVPAAFGAADFIFVFGLALVLMFYAYELYPSNLFAVTGTAIVMCFNWHDLLLLVRYLRGEPQNSTFILRTPYPQLPLLSFIWFLFALKKMVERPTAWRAIAVVASFTLNFYSYFYSWTIACLTFFAVLVLITLGMAKKGVLPECGQTTKTRAFGFMLASGTVTMILTTPVWMAMFRKTPEVADSFLRLNGVYTHLPYVAYAALLPALFILSVLGRRRGLQINWIVPPFIIASLCAMNLQVVLGRTIQPNHWSSYYIQPILILVFVQSAWPFAQRFMPRTLTLVAILLVGVGISQNLAKFWTSAVESREFNQKDPAFEALVARMNAKELAGFGFVTNDYYLLNVLPGYVRQKPLAPSYMDPISDLELWELRLAALKAAGFENWEQFSQVSGQGGTPIIETSPIQYDSRKVLLVMNRHRKVPDAAIGNHCELMSNRDFLVLKPRPQQSSF